MINYIFIDSKTLTVFVNGKPYTVTESSTPNFQKVKDHLKVNDPLMENEIIDLLDLEKVINIFGKKKLYVKHSIMYYDDMVISDLMHNRILEMIQHDFSVEPLLKFLDKLSENPNPESVKDLYLFMSKNSLPIIDDGDFLAYKKVTFDYMDIYTKSISNVIGAVVTMPRDKVNADRTEVCSSGLHVCSYDYLTEFGSTVSNNDKVIIVKVNPKDVVSVPTDYNNAKMRVCEYTVYSELTDYREERLPDYYSTNNSDDDEEVYSTEEYDNEEEEYEFDDGGISKDDNFSFEDEEYIMNYISNKTGVIITRDTDLSSVMSNNLQKYNFLRHFCSEYNIPTSLLKVNKFTIVNDIIDFIEYNNK